jgi:hypothetical protein
MQWHSNFNANGLQATYFTWLVFRSECLKKYFNGVVDFSNFVPWYVSLSEFFKVYRLSNLYLFFFYIFKLPIDSHYSEWVTNKLDHYRDVIWLWVWQQIVFKKHLTPDITGAKTNDPTRHWTSHHASVNLLFIFCDVCAMK